MVVITHKFFTNHLKTILARTEHRQRLSHGGLSRHFSTCASQLALPSNVAVPRKAIWYTDEQDCYCYEVK